MNTKPVTIIDNKGNRHTFATRSEAARFCGIKLITTLSRYVDNGISPKPRLKGWTFREGRTKH